MTTIIDGQLQIDHEHGVIYFHIKTQEDYIKYGPTVLRICNLPKIPKIKSRMLNITHMISQDW